MKTYKIIFGIGILFTLFLTACTQNSPTGNLALDSTVSSDGMKEITISLHNWELKQKGPQINKGDKVRLKVKGVSGLHGISIPDLELATGLIGPGEEEILEFEATKSGTFDYYCNVYCGHGHTKMIGKLNIQDEVKE